LIFSNYDDLVKQMGTELSKAFQQHAYLQPILQQISEDPRKSEFARHRVLADLNYFSSYLNHDKSIDTCEVEHSLVFLSGLLHDHFGKTVFIFIDDYDTPIKHVYLDGTYISDGMLLLGNLLGNTFKGNSYLKKGLLTGVFRFAKEDLLSGFNNVYEATDLTEAFSLHYGFTEQEVQALFEEHGTEQNDRIRAM